MIITGTFQMMPFSQPAKIKSVCSVRDLIREASYMTGFTPAEIKGGSRHKPLARTRFAICYVAYRHLGKSYPEIGAALGSRDHTSIIHAKRRAAQLIGYDEDLTELVEHLSRYALSVDARRAA